MCDDASIRLIGQDALVKILEGSSAQETGTPYILLYKKKNFLLTQKLEDKKDNQGKKDSEQNEQEIKKILSTLSASLQKLKEKLSLLRKRLTELVTHAAISR